MAITELASGRNTTGKTAQRLYRMTSQSNEAAARAALIAAVGTAVIPSSIGDLLFDEQSSGVEEIEENDYIGTVVYTSPEWQLQERNAFSVSFDISGQARKMAQSLGTIARYFQKFGDERDFFTIPNFKGAINVNSDGDVEGVDIIEPQLVYTITKTFANSAITDSYVGTVSQIVGTVNNSTYHGFSAGELLLTRVSGQPRQDEDWDVNFGFSISKNRTDIPTPGYTTKRVYTDDATFTDTSATTITKEGWDYLWTYFDWEVVDLGGGNKIMKKRPVSSHVERVYPRTNYTLLGI